MQSSPWMHSASASTAGALQTVFWHPLDVLKTRMQVQDARLQGGELPRYRSLVHAIRSIAQLEGPRGFFRGVLPSVLGSSLAWGIQMPLYAHLKQTIGAESVGSQHERTFFYFAPRDIVCSFSAGCITNLVVHPVFLIKTRMQLQAQPDSLGRSTYRSSTHAILSIVREEGVGGLYRGFYPSLLLSTHGAILLASYDHFKALYPSVVLASFSAKIFATTVTYPLQVLRAVMQQRPLAHEPFPYTDVKTTATILWKNGGVRAFYRGICPQMMRTVPQSMAFFSIYEHTLGVFSKFVVAIPHSK